MPTSSPDDAADGLAPDAQPTDVPAGAPAPDAHVPDAPVPDAPGPDAPAPDTPVPDAPVPDAPGPHAPAPDAPRADLDDRYGRTAPTAGRARGLRALAWAGGVLATVGAGWAGWSMVAGEPWTTKEVGFSVRSPELTEVTFHVTKRADITLRCRVVALAQSYAQVGVLDVTIPPSSGERESFTVDVRTSELATTGVVESCEAVED